MRRCLVAVVVLGMLAGCAQPKQPTGGPPIDRPLQVVDVSPAPFSVLTELDRPVVIRFDERLSERLQGVRDLREAVIVSPETGEVRVRRGRRELRISMAGGWQPGLVYRVVVLPVLRDLFNNVRAEPVELVFSTGPAIPETAVAGFIEDRLTGRVVGGARIEATHEESRHTYVALSDSAGFFALRHVPEGRYELQAWLDQNRNRIADLNEPQDSARFALAARDTVVMELSLLPGDTVPARLARARPIDATKIELTFDDYFEPVPGPIDGSGRVYRFEDSTFVADGTIFHATMLDSLQAAEAPPAIAAADTLDAQADTAAVAAALPRQDPPRDGARVTPRAATEPQRPLPSRELILLLGMPLEPETRYFVVVEGVANIQGVPGGGGTVGFSTPAAPSSPADPDPPDAPDAPDPPDPPDPPDGAEHGEGPGSAAPTGAADRDPAARRTTAP